MNLLAAIFVAGVGLYTIYCGPRSWPHWLAGCAALGFAIVDQVFPFEASGRGVGFSLVAALCLSAATYLVSRSARNLQWAALTLAVGTFPLLVPNMGYLPRQGLYYVSYIFVGLLSLIFLIAPGRYWTLKRNLAVLLTVLFLGVAATGSVVFHIALYFMPVWGGALLIFRASKYTGRIENAFWRVGLIFVAAGFIFAFHVFLKSFNLQLHTGLDYVNRDPALTELSAWLAPLLVAVGIVATCVAVVRLIPRQPDTQTETIEPAEQPNPL